MFNKSKLAAILEDEGLIKTASIPLTDEMIDLRSTVIEEMVRGLKQIGLKADMGSMRVKGRAKQTVEMEGSARGLSTHPRLRYPELRDWVMSATIDMKKPRVVVELDAPWTLKNRFFVKQGQNPKSAISKALSGKFGIGERLDEAIAHRIKLEEERRAEEAAQGPVVAIVTTAGGRKSEYKLAEIQGFLDNKGQIIMSDNLPRWLWEASNMASLNDPSWGRDDVPGFPGANDHWNEIWQFLEKVKGASKPVQINVQSDDRSKNRIKF